jgi:hypothetical protein
MLTQLNISRFNPPTKIKNNVSAAHSGHKIRLSSTKIFNCSFIHSAGLQSEQEALEEDREMTDYVILHHKRFHLKRRTTHEYYSIQGEAIIVTVHTYPCTVVDVYSGTPLIRTPSNLK